MIFWYGETVGTPLPAGSFTCAPANTLVLIPPFKETRYLKKINVQMTIRDTVAHQFVTGVSIILAQGAALGSPGLRMNENSAGWQDPIALQQQQFTVPVNGSDFLEFESESIMLNSDTNINFVMIDCTFTPAVVAVGGASIAISVVLELFPERKSKWHKG